MRPPVIAIVYGIFMIAAGIAGYFITGAKSPTPLMGAAFGLVGALLGGASLLWEGARKHLMHAFCLVVLLAGLPTTIRFFISARQDGKEVVAAFLAVIAVASWVTLGLMVKSFIDARRARAA